MSDALPLPPRPHLDQYRKLAKDLQHACRSTDSAAVRAWATRWLETLGRLRGQEMASADTRRAVAREAERIEHRWRQFLRVGEHQRCRLADTQLFVAREHGFASWPRFAEYVQSVTRPGSSISNFETAVEAIVAGNATELRRLLRAHPALARARSSRDHHSTLLHYVSANGVEDFRQKTPHNIVEITRILLDAGADVNATSEAYGGGSTALGLAATSLHPQAAGVQIALLETLLKHGAKIEQGAASDDGSAITGCLANGQPEAASYLAGRGAILNLEGAAGLGRLDDVRTFFDERGALLPTATKEQLESGLLYACGYGHPHVVRFFLERGVDPNLRRNGETPLHWASFGPHPEIAHLLLKHHAAVDVRDDRFKSTPLDWTLYAWAKAEGDERERGYEMVAALIGAGARVEDTAAERVGDPRMEELLKAGRRSTS
jgi:ankyrin repeat protein